MKNINFVNKKIGIWGFGIVGQSVLKHIQQFTNHIQIMDRKADPNAHIIPETPKNIANFLEHNDIIIPSPGIILHNYQSYADKFVQELDIFTQEFQGSTIAITGTVGKTTVTSLLAQATPDAIAAGNIGYAMLHVLDLQPQKSNVILQSTLSASTDRPALPVGHSFSEGSKRKSKSFKKVILELSSYQLQFAKNFAPDLAIWTNFYPNHLDHHENEQEYFDAKCNILRHQTGNQFALLPADLIKKIEQTIQPQAHIYLFCENMDPRLPPTPLAMADSDAACPPKLLSEGWKDEEEQSSSVILDADRGSSHLKMNYPLFFIHNNQLQLHENNETKIIFDNFDQLPDITFAQNWLVIVAALYLQNIDLQNFLTFTQTLKPEEHRCEFVKNLNNVAVYNDSKSTVWQATKHAVDKFHGKKIALFLGGISKGTDRTPLLQHLKNKNVTVFAFGKEAELLTKLCQQFNVTHHSASTLQEALQQYLNLQHNFEILLFSPAGASFDLFKNFEDRGTQFKKMIQKL